jgi:hypothetical protein
MIHALSPSVLALLILRSDLFLATSVSNMCSASSYLWSTHVVYLQSKRISSRFLVFCSNDLDAVIWARKTQCLKLIQKSAERASVYLVVNGIQHIEKTHTIEREKNSCVLKAYTTVTSTAAEGSLRPAAALQAPRASPALSLPSGWRRVEGLASRPPPQPQSGLLGEHLAPQDRSQAQGPSRLLALPSAGPRSSHLCCLRRRSCRSCRSRPSRTHVICTQHPAGGEDRKLSVLN